MFTSLACNCSDTSGTESDPGYGGDSCCGTSGDECPCSIAETDCYQATNFQSNFNSLQTARFGGQQPLNKKLSQERRTSQPNMSASYGKTLPGCTCSQAGRHSSVLSNQQQQQQPQPVYQTVSGQQRTSFTNNNGTAVPPEYRVSQQMAQAMNENANTSMTYQNMQQPPLISGRLSNNVNAPQRSGSNVAANQPSLTAQRISAQQNGQGCQNPVCQGAAGSRKSSHTSTGSAAKLRIPSGNTPPAGSQVPGMFDMNQFLPPPQVNNSVQLNSGQQISPCCLPPPPEVVFEGGPCFCPDNPGAPQKIQNNQDSGCACSQSSSQPTNSDKCPSCAEFDGPTPEPECVCEPEPEPECEPEPEPEPEPINLEVPVPKKSGKKQSGFWQQVQFQICQQMGGDDQNNGNENEHAEINLQEVNATEKQEEVQGEQDCPCSDSNTKAKYDQAPINATTSGTENRSQGKTWQQLTLDIFQSQGGSSEQDDEQHESNGSKSGWQQQLRLSIYQEQGGNNNGNNNGNAMTTTVSDDNAPPEILLNVPDSSCGC